LLYSSERQARVALLFAESSITGADFRAGVQAASGQITFTDYRQSFNNVAGLVSMLQQVDAEHFDAICIVRGGGSGLEVFDKPKLATALMSLATPTITAIGHEQDLPLLCKVSDRNIGTPSLLGQYFKDMVESVNEKKTKSHAALTEKIKKQFQQQLEAGQKQNKALQEKLTQITKANEEAQRKQAEAMGKLQEQLKTQTEASTKQAKDFGDKLTKMQETNSQLQKTLDRVNTQNTESAKQLAVAKEQARTLQKQLAQAQNRPSNLALPLIMGIIILALLVALIVK
jgi:exonuclease VII large subunit